MQRITAIDIMQGTAMVLVVLGHHFFDFMPEWYGRMYYWIYTFHMPLFVFISGFLVRYSYKGVTDMGEYRTYVGKRFRKFAIPYIIVGVVCALLSWDFKDIGVLGENLLNLFIAPKQGEARFLWYIHLLFVFYMIAPLVFNAKRAVRWCVMAVALYFSVYHIPDNLFNADYFTRYFIFFLSGAVVAENYAVVKCMDVRWSMVALVLFVAMSVWHFMYGYNALLEYMLQWVGIPAFLCVAWVIGKMPLMRDVLVGISKNCFVIYLLHMFVIQGVAVLLRLSGMGLTAYTAIPYLLLSTTLAISIPMMTNIKRKR